MAIKLGIIGAMEVEVDHLIAQLSEPTLLESAGMRFYAGTMHGTDTVVVRCGVGKVNAAMCTQKLIDQYAVTHIINTGVAGALDRALKVGDLVISTDAVEHDMNVGALGYQPGLIPELVDMHQVHGKLSFEADEQLRGICLRAAREVAPEVKVVEGRVASGDVFVFEQDERDRIIGTFGATCCEMEGAAIAHVCWRNSVPFAIVRAISDNADATSQTEYRVHEADIARHCAGIVSRATELLAASQA